MDLSSISTEDLQKIAGSSQQSTQGSQSASPDLSKISTDDLQRIAGQAKPQQPEGNMLSRVANSGVVTGINALGGGAQQTLANSIGKAGGLVGDLTGAKQITDASKFVSNTLQPSKFVQDAQARDPGLSMAGNVVGGAMAMGLTGGGAEAALGAKMAPIAANAVLGGATAGQGTQNRLIGAGLGVTAGKLTDSVIGTLSSKFEASATAKDGINTIDEFITNNGHKLDDESINSLNGVKKILKAGVPAEQQSTGLAGKIGQVVKDNIVGIAGGAVGAVTGGTILHTVGGLVLGEIAQSKIGPALIGYIGSHPGGFALAKQLISHTAAISAGSAESKLDH